jgi:2-polyprenyl-3-methyl-5-hydroxy-6-metoxy-1,4-benzoquinol methylase
VNLPALELAEMPFYWRVHERGAPGLAGVPTRLPYAFEVMPDLGLLIERRSERLLACLDTVYRAESNVGFMQDGHSLAKGYGGDFLDFIARATAPLAIRSVVEIGCGGCYLLEKLRERGYEVTGVDPSPIAAAKGREKGIRVIGDFFPSPRLDFKADLIFHVDVFEHVADPVAFLRAQRGHLGADGYVIINTPDCTASIAAGDVSIAFHQHLNSYDERTLSNAVTAAGLHVVVLEKAKFGGSLYCLASVKRPAAPFKVAVPEGRAAAFLGKAAGALARFRALAEPLFARGVQPGFYMPLRAIPYLASIERLEGLRLFDDIGHWHRRYIDGLEIPIENFEDLVARPPEHLFIMSLTFGEVVKRKVLERVPGLPVTTLQDIVAA